jgi:hypothetical protein
MAPVAAGHHGRVAEAGDAGGAAARGARAAPGVRRGACRAPRPGLRRIAAPERHKRRKAASAVSVVRPPTGSGRHRAFTECGALGPARPTTGGRVPVRDQAETGAPANRSRPGRCRREFERELRPPRMARRAKTAEAGGRIISGAGTRLRPEDTSAGHPSPGPHAAPGRPAVFAPRASVLRRGENCAQADGPRGACGAVRGRQLSEQVSAGALRAGVGLRGATHESGVGMQGCPGVRQGAGLRGPGKPGAFGRQAGERRLDAGYRALARRASA